MENLKHLIESLWRGLGKPGFFMRQKPPEATTGEMVSPIPGWRPAAPELGSLLPEDLLQQHQALVIHFWANWNGSDILMDRSLQSVASQWQPRLRFFSCDVDQPENLPWCQKFQVANVPTIVFLKSGSSPQILVGCRRPEELSRQLELFLEDLPTQT